MMHLMISDALESLGSSLMHVCNPGVATARLIGEVQKQDLGSVRSPNPVTLIQAQVLSFCCDPHFVVSVYKALVCVTALCSCDLHCVVPAYRLHFCFHALSGCDPH